MEKNICGWGDGLVDKVLTVQVEEQEFRCPEPTQELCRCGGSPVSSCSVGGRRIPGKLTGNDIYISILLIFHFYFNTMIKEISTSQIINLSLLWDYFELIIPCVVWFSAFLSFSSFLQQPSFCSAQRMATFGFKQSSSETVSLLLTTDLIRNIIQVLSKSCSMGLKG